MKKGLPINVLNFCVYYDMQVRGIILDQFFILLQINRIIRGYIHTLASINKLDQYFLNGKKIHAQTGHSFSN